MAGLISLAVGSIMLFQNAPGYHTSKPLVIGVAVALGAVWVFAMSKALQVRHSPVEVGPQLIAGSVGEVRENGLVYVNGELWQARAAGGQELRRGERVRVESLDGLVLTVRPEGPHGGITVMNVALVIVANMLFLVVLFASLG